MTTNTTPAGKIRPAQIRALIALNAAPDKCLAPYPLAMAARVTPQGYRRMVDVMERELLIGRNETEDNFRWTITFRGLQTVQQHNRETRT
jgi:hypothetical protein